MNHFYLNSSSGPLDYLYLMVVNVVSVNACLRMIIISAQVSWESIRSGCIMISFKGTFAELLYIRFCDKKMGCIKWIGDKIGFGGVGNH